MPVNLHILTGHGYHKETVFGNKRTGVEAYRGSVNLKLKEIIDAFFELIFYGVMDRYPKLRFVSVENEIGWMPFYIQQWDYYYKRNVKHGGAEDFLIKRLPSEIFNEHVYATFMDDFVGGQNLKFWGEHNIMWSSDYPHPNMTWPNSRAFLARQIGDLDPARQKLVLSQNVIDLYKLKL